MRRFFFFLFCAIACLGMFAWWQPYQERGAHPFQKDTLTYQSLVQSDSWREFIPPEVISISPLDAAEDVVIGIEDPIRVRFSSSVKYSFVDFSLSPSVELAFENNSEKTEFRLLPKSPLQDGTVYVLTVQYRHRESDENVPMTEIARSTFTTLPAPPGTWSTDLQTRLVEAKRFTRPQKTSGKYIDINLKSQVMTIFEEGNLVDAFVVSSGLVGMDTPKGEYVIHNKALRPWSKRYLLYMPYWMAITPDGKYGIHELPEWPGGYKEGANHLGRPVSHGCVRLGVGAARTVYDWAPEGTPVIIH